MRNFIEIDSQGIVVSTIRSSSESDPDAPFFEITDQQSRSVELGEPATPELLAIAVAKGVRQAAS